MGDQLSVASYRPSELGFMGTGHCQWWNRTPLAGQDPHIWTVIFILAVVGISYVFWKKSRTKNRNNEKHSFEKMNTEMEAKERRLNLKLQGLDEKLAEGLIGKAEYQALYHQYQKQLTQIEAKMKAFTDLKDS